MQRWITGSRGPDWQAAVVAVCNSRDRVDCLVSNPIRRPGPAPLVWSVRCDGSCRSRIPDPLFLAITGWLWCRWSSSVVTSWSSAGVPLLVEVVAELGHCLDFDLSDAFSGDPVEAADFFEGARLAVGETESQPNNAGLPLG